MIRGSPECCAFVGGVQVGVKTMVANSGGTITANTWSFYGYKGSGLEISVSGTHKFLDHKALP